MKVRYSSSTLGVVTYCTYHTPSFTGTMYSHFSFSVLVLYKYDTGAITTLERYILGRYYYLGTYILVYFFFTSYMISAYN